MNEYIHTCVNTYIHKYIYTYTHANTHTYIIYPHTYIHMHIHSVWGNFQRGVYLGGFRGKILDTITMERVHSSISNTARNINLQRTHFDPFYFYLLSEHVCCKFLLFQFFSI